MDPEISLIMANLALAQRGSQVFDPFCGSGRIACACALFGAATLALDINARILFGKSSSSSCIAHSRGIDTEVDFIHGSALAAPVQSNSLDAIVTDPPYGFRHSLETDSSTVDLFASLLQSASRHLRVGGRLVFIMPSTQVILAHSSLRLLHACTLNIGKQWNRVLLVMEKVASASGHVERANITPRSERNIPRLRHAVYRSLLHRSSEIPLSPWRLAWRGELAALQQLGGFDFSLKDGKGNTCLHWAAGYNHAKLCAWLLERCDADALNNRMQTALSTAARRGHRAVVEVLLRSTHTPDGAGLTPMMLAANWGHLPCLELLLAAGPDLEAHSRSGDTALHLAAQHGAFECAELLIQHNANVHALNNERRTPLHKATEWGHLKVVELLCLHGADVNARDCLGETPLHDAFFHSRPDCLEYLTSKGADQHAVNNFGQVPAEVQP
jgi:predicted RNA methylase